MRWNFLSPKRRCPVSIARRAPRAPARAALLAEMLEQRIAPVSLVAGPNLLQSGEVGTIGLFTLIAVNKGPVIVWMSSQYGGIGVETPGALSGISMSHNASVTLFTDVTGDIVTNLDPDGTLSGPLNDGSVLLHADIGAITFSNIIVTYDVDPITGTRTPISTDTGFFTGFNIWGNVLAGGSVKNIGTIESHDFSLGLQANSTPAGPIGRVGIIATGTAAGGRLVQFSTNSIAPVPEEFDLQPGAVRLLPYNPKNGVSYDISNVQVTRAYGMITGDGFDDATGAGGRGGDIRDVVISTDEGGFYLVTGQGGDGLTQGGRGGNILNVTIGGQSSPVANFFTTGHGGAGFGPKGVGGNGGNIVNLNLTGSGAYQFSIGDGGLGTVRGGDGGSLTGVTKEDKIQDIPPTTVEGLTGSISYQLQALPADIAGGDFNGDGLLDIVVVNGGSSDISVQLGIGNARFGRVINYTAGPRPGYHVGASSVAVGDFNGDGIDDIAATFSWSETVAVWLGNGIGIGDGTFTWIGTYKVGHNPRDIVVADFNGDGALDIAALNTANVPDGPYFRSGLASTVSMLFGAGDGTFLTRTDPFSAWENDFFMNAPFTDPLTAGIAMTVGDFDSDGRPDLAITSDVPDVLNPNVDSVNAVGGIFGVYLNRANGSGLFESPFFFAGLGGSEYTQAITTADVDLDGALDIVIGTRTADSDSPAHDMQVFFGTGTGFFLSGSHLGPNGALGDPRAVAVGDANGDGLPDIIVASFGGQLQLLPQNGNGGLPNGTFGNPVSVAGSTGLVSLLTLSDSLSGWLLPDLNNDGRLDAVAVSQTEGAAVVFLGVTAQAAGTGVFEFFTFVKTDTESPRVVGNDNPVSVAFADINGDGIQDMAVANSGSNSVVVYLGNGDGNFYNTPALTTFVYTMPRAGAVPTVVSLSPFVAGGVPNLIVAGYDPFSGDDGFVWVFPAITTIVNNVVVGTGVFDILGVAEYPTNGVRPVDMVVADMGGYSAANPGGPADPPDVLTDGGLDIVVANYGAGGGDGGSVSILYQNISTGLPPGPNGTFRDGFLYGVGFLDRPSSVVVQDMYGNPLGGTDGQLEIITANQGDGTIKILRGNLTPAAPPGIPLQIVDYVADISRTTLGTLPAAVRVADLNGDGILDVIAVNYDNDLIVAYFGTLFGVAVAPSFSQFLPAGSSGPTDMLVFDVNGDGIPDVITVNALTNNLNVFIGLRLPFVPYGLNAAFVLDLPAGSEINPPGNPTLPPPPVLRMAAGVLNQDTAPDLAVTHFTSDQVSIWLSSARQFASGVSFDTLPHPPTSLQLRAGSGGDSGGQGGAGGKISNVTLTVTGAGFDDRTRPVDVASGSFLTDNSRSNFATANAGANSVSVAGLNYPVAPEPRTVAVADFNGDGIVDIATVSFIDNRLYILLGNGLLVDRGHPHSSGRGHVGEFWLQQRDGIPISFPIGGDGALDMVTGDFNADGVVDIAIANVFSGNVTVLFGIAPTEIDLNTGLALASFSAPLLLSLPSGAMPQAILANDFNSDGRLDLVTANFGTNSASVFLATGAGTFGAAVSYSVGRGPSAVQYMDVDDDGDDDLLVANFADNNVSVLFNDGTGAFTIFGTPINLNPQGQVVNNPVGLAVLPGDVLAVVSQSTSIVVFTASQGNGLFQIRTPPQSLTLGTGSAPWTVAQNPHGSFPLYIPNCQTNEVANVFPDPNNYATTNAPVPVEGGEIDQVAFASGSGGDGASSSGGHGGDVRTLNVTVERPSNLVVATGDGGSGFTSGGNGGNLLGTATSPLILSIPQPNQGRILINTGNGGLGINSNGGSGGRVQFLNWTALYDQLEFVFTEGVQIITGRGGDSIAANGGVGGSLLDVTGLFDFFDGGNSHQELMFVRLGDGGNGSVSGGAGGTLARVTLTANVTPNVFDVASLYIQTGGGGNGLSKAGGTGGGINSVTLNNFIGTVLLLAGAGGDGATGGNGGNVNSITLTPLSNAITTTLQILSGSGGFGTVKNGGAGGSILKISGDVSDLVLFAAGDGGGSAGGKGGKGGSISTITLTATVFKSFFTAGDGGAGFKAGGAGGNLNSLNVSASLAMSLQAGNGGAAGGLSGKGGNGGSVFNYTQKNNPNLVISQIIGGDGGFGVKAGGRGGNVTGINAFGFIGDFTAQLYGPKTQLEMLSMGAPSHIRFGGIFAGIGGDSGPLGKPGANGSVSSVTARAITNIVAGAGFAPLAAASISGITVTALGINPLIYGFSPLGRDVDGDGAFDFIDGILVNGLYDAGEAPLDGLILANKISGITVQKQPTNHPAMLGVPLFQFNPLLGTRLGLQDPN